MNLRKTFSPIILVIFLFFLSMGNTSLLSQTEQGTNIDLENQQNTKGLPIVKSCLDKEGLFTYKLGSLGMNLKQMEKDGVIPNYSFAMLIIKIMQLEKKIQRGIYSFEKDTGTWKAINRLKNGDEDVCKITIKEGDDIYEIAKSLLAKNLIGSQEDFLQFAKNPNTIERVYQKIGLVNQKKPLSIEGFLYPNTYSVRASRVFSELLQLSTDEFQKKMQKLLMESNVPKSRWLEMLTRASLIEKETILDSEKGLVSSVIQNRLNKKMRLGFDSSLIYTLKEVDLLESSKTKEGAIDIKRKHFTINYPYNTFIKKGLPPGTNCQFYPNLTQSSNLSRTERLPFLPCKKKRGLQGWA